MIIEQKVHHESIACRILYSTQSGRSKACARRVARIINDCNRTYTRDGRSGSVRLLNGQGTTFDDALTDASASTIEDYVQHIKESGNSITPSSSSTCLLICFVSTTGDGEHTDTIQQFWKKILQKSLSKTLFDGVSIAIFSLGDRCYGPDKFCAAGRKFIIRLVQQLSATLFVQPGYGDDGTNNGGVFIDLDHWLYTILLPRLFPLASVGIHAVAAIDDSNDDDVDSHRSLYNVDVTGDRKRFYNTVDSLHTNCKEEWQQPEYRASYLDFFERQRPRNAYHYSLRSSTSMNKTEIVRIPSNRDSDDGRIESTVLLGRVVENKRITADYWQQDTRHIILEVSTTCNGDLSNGIRSSENDCVLTNENNFEIDNFQARTCASDANDWSLDKLLYRAGDVAVIMPSNTVEEVNSFLKVLPVTLQQLADNQLSIHCNEKINRDNSSVFRGIGYKFWPTKCTLRGFLTYCADIHALPEREDLRALASYCSNNGKHQIEKLMSLSETKDSALYVDYIIREKRSWVDVLYDFDSLRDQGSKLTIEAILGLLLPIRPRLFSIASSPTKDWISRKEVPRSMNCFTIELGVAVVEGTTRLGRSFHGLCSNYLRRVGSIGSDGSERFVRLWIQPGSFHGLPLDYQSQSTRVVPVLCIGAGTGVAPLRSIIHELEAVWSLTCPALPAIVTGPHTTNAQNTLIFGCRKKDADFYYENEWAALAQTGRTRLLTAFSQDQWHKIYVQQVLTSDSFGSDQLVSHIVNENGAIYIAGGPKMAKSVNDVMAQALIQQSIVPDEKHARKFLTKLQVLGLYCVEAWS